MNFFEMSDDESDSNLQKRLADWDESVDIEQIICPVDEGHARGGKRITPLAIVLPSADVQDFVWLWGSGCLVTEKVNRLFHRSGLTGYKLEPATVASVKRKKDRGRPVPKLWQLEPTGTVRASASAGLYVKERCEACGYIRYSAYEHGLPVDESTWDGSDFFRFEEWGGLYVTERVKDVVERHALTGVAFVRVEDLIWPDCVIKP